ncbi:MAG TPA: hypothetical protein VEX68_14790 [Bryobacteraceae bacterium]|nr:hypothetical protein [Bryobacteraceae bacterium]
MLVFDRGYADYGCWLLLTRQKLNFVTGYTTMPSAASYELTCSWGGAVIREE